MEIKDLIIIGLGPAGIAAGIYAKRAGLDFLIIKSRFLLDSQIINTLEIENYVGLNKVSGQVLYDTFLNHLKSFDVKIIDEKVLDIDVDGVIKTIRTDKNEYKTKTIILATGAKPQMLSIEGEEKYLGQGVSYCATCDGAFYKDKTVAVVGGGDVALEDALFLRRICKKVYLILRRDVFVAQKVYQDEILKYDNIEVLYNTNITKINGDEFVRNIDIKNNKTGEEKNISIDGIFIAIGIKPNTELLKDKVKMEKDYIIADETCETSIKGVYACGDIRKKQLRQVITATSDGANAITSIVRYLS